MDQIKILQVIILLQADVMNHLEDVISLLQLDLVVLMESHHAGHQQPGVRLCELVTQRRGTDVCVLSSPSGVEQQPRLLDEPVDQQHLNKNTNIYRHFVCVCNIIVERLSFFFTV